MRAWQENAGSRRLACAGAAPPAQAGMPSPGFAGAPGASGRGLRAAASCRPLRSIFPAGFACQPGGVSPMPLLASLSTRRPPLCSLWAPEQSSHLPSGRGVDLVQRRVHVCVGGHFVLHLWRDLAPDCIDPYTLGSCHVLPFMNLGAEDPSGWLRISGIPEPRGACFPKRRCHVTPILHRGPPPMSSQAPHGLTPSGPGLRVCPSDDR